MQLYKANILAHRGWWKTQSEKNTITAFDRALKAGFGVETDVRDQEGELVLSHDPPPRGSKMPALRILLDMAANAPGGVLALNIKSDGLADKLAELLSKFPSLRTFVFDMSIPDTRRYLELGIPVATRLSEHEKEHPFPGRQSGVWIDSFSGSTPQVDQASQVVAQSMFAAIVSPELHGRRHELLWRILRNTALPADKVLLCTDLPNEALSYFRPACTK